MHIAKFNHPVQVPIDPVSALCCSGLTGANDNNNCLVCPSSEEGQTPGRGRDTIFPVSLCSEVGGTFLVENTQAQMDLEKAPPHAVLSSERARAEIECCVYLQREQVSTHRASECFD